MKVKNDADELAVQRKQEKYRTDRAALEQEVDAYYDKSKPDPDGGLKKARGPVGNIASAIAQFMGAYAAIISGSPNFANQILNRKIDQHVDAQLEEFKRGKMKRDGQLQRMAERGLSIEQMKTALKLQQERYVQKEVEMRAAAEGTREAKAAKDVLLLDRRERALSLEQQFERESLGETSVSGDIVQPRAGGLVPLTPEERLGRAVARTKLANEFGYELEGGAPAERAAEREDKRAERAEVRADRLDARKAQESQLTEAQAKAEAAHQAVTHLGGKAGLVRDKKTGKWVVGGGAVPPGLLEKVGETVTGGFYQGDIAPAFDAAVEAFGRQQSGGVIGKDERPEFETQLGKKTFTRQQLANRLNAAELNIEAKRKQDVNGVRAGRTNAAPPSWQRKDEEDEK